MNLRVGAGVAAVAALISCGVANATRIPMYLAYDPVYTDYFYTTNLAEHNSALSGGYTEQGVAFYVEDSSTSGALAFQRFYKGAPQYEHFYTTSSTEASAVISGGYGAEGNEGYLFSTQADGSVPIYRFSLFNDQTGDLEHFYTTDASDVSSLPSQGWTYEGVAGYGFTRAGVADDYKAVILAYHAGEVNDCYGYSSAVVALQRGSRPEAWCKN